MEKEGICGAVAVALHSLGQQGAPAASSRRAAAADRTLGKFRPRGASQPRGPGQDTAALGAAPPSPAVGSAQYLPAPSGRSLAPHPQLTQCPALSSYPQRTVLPGLFAVGSVYCTRGCMVTPGQTSAPADPSGAAAGRLAAFPARLEGPREREDSCRAPWSPFP